MLHHIHSYVDYLNNNKAFAAILMIILNIGSRIIPININKSLENLIKQSYTRYVLIFAMLWLGARDIYIALLLMFLFIVIVDVLLNDECTWCVIPQYYRAFESVDENGDGVISEEELTNALKTINTAKLQKRLAEQRHNFLSFYSP